MPPSHFEHNRRDVLGVEVFSVGTHTDSAGQELTVDAALLDSIVAAFNNGNPSMVPVKFGHTSSAFNVEQAAELLGITPGLITGEGKGQEGAILPGTVTKLSRHQNKLLADFDVLSPVADMITDGMLKGISIELSDDDVITSITMLGAQRPAVKDLASLQAAIVLSESKLYAFAMNTEGAKVVRRGFHTAEERLRVTKWVAQDLGLDENATINEVITRVEEIRDQTTEESTMDEKAIRESLGLDEKANIGAAITALKEKAAKPEPKPSFSERLRSYFSLGKDATEAEVLAKIEISPEPTTSTAGHEFTEEVKKGFAERDAKIALLERTNRLSFYREQVTGLSLVPGTPDELAEKLVATEEAQSPEAATERLTEWQKTQEFATAANVGKPVGSNGTPALEGAEHPFEQRVKNYAEANKVTPQKALAVLSVSDPTAFATYRREITES